jgi:hypothetical protein
VAKARARHEDAMRQLRRRMSQSQPYAAVVNQQQLQRMKQQRLAHADAATVAAAHRTSRLVMEKAHAVMAQLDKWVLICNDYEEVTEVEREGGR